MGRGVVVFWFVPYICVVQLRLCGSIACVWFNCSCVVRLDSCGSISLLWFNSEHLVQYHLRGPHNTSLEAASHTSKQSGTLVSSSHACIVTTRCSLGIGGQRYQHSPSGAPFTYEVPIHDDGWQHRCRRRRGHRIWPVLVGSQRDTCTPFNSSSDRVDFVPSRYR